MSIEAYQVIDPLERSRLYHGHKCQWQF